jgi:transglutaminase-like putative cysteine protease
MVIHRWSPPAAAAAVVAIIAATTPLGPISRAIAIACVVASFAAAAFAGRKPDRGGSAIDVRAHATVIAAIAGVVAAGQVNASALYGVLSAGFLLVCVASFRAQQRTAQTRPDRARVAVILAVSGATCAIAVLTLPPLAVRIERTVTSMFGADPLQATAFSTHMQLGATHDLLQSDAIVARIDNGEPEYLRGAVYDRYTGEGWTTTSEGRTRRLVAATPPSSSRPTTHITLDKSAPTGSDDLRWFLPPAACAFDHEVEVDLFGVARRVSGDRELSFSMSGCTPAVTRPATAMDLDISPSLAATLAPLAAQWSAGATTEKEKLERISRELAKFEYSLDVPRDKELDPIVDFLTVHKAGHCEYFASTMVLMARTQGIHARVIGGFRVSEVNPITHQSIVRDRNAHAWVEAWYGGEWHAWDPTPASGGPGWGRSFLDHAGDLWSLAWDRLASIGPLGYAIVLLAIIAVLLVIRSIGNFLGRPRRRRSQQAMDKPLPCFEALTNALSAKGFSRDEAEPIEAFAGRIPHADIAAALNAYAAFRYGGIGEEAAVVRAAEDAVKVTSSLSGRAKTSS